MSDESSIGSSAGSDAASSLILPGQSAPDAQALDKLPPVVWLRNPKTGVIFKFHREQHADTIKRCLGESPAYTLSSEAAARAQAVELARLQGRPLPPWADEDKPADKPATKAGK